MTEIQVDSSRSGRRGQGGAGPTPPAAASGGRAAARKSRKKPRRVLRIVAFTSAGAVLVTAGVGAYVYEKLNGNIQSAPLFAGASGDAGHETPDAFGRTPINILVIGSDTRDNAADCQIGGDCGSGANADVEMVLHVSADRSNATVMSIPRDTVTQLPACNDTQNHTSMKAQRGQINSTLDYGPGCTVAAVHQLSGIPIDHFVTVDFTGVVQMSDAVGGVPVCVSDNVYDPDSGLKLKQGNHTLKGMAALQFVRSRHGFGDGSDLGRTVTQHLFIGSMVRQLKSAGTLTNPAAVYSLANAATKALTVDTGLSGIPQLIGLANDLNKVPSDRITFTTMQNEPDPSDPNRVVVAPAAQNLFKTITNDQSLTTGSGDKSSAAAQATGNATAPAAPAAAPTTSAPKPAGAPASEIAVQVKNGSSVSGRGAAIKAALVGQGYSSRSTDATGAVTDKTTVSYTAGREADAQEVAASLGLPATAVVPGSGSGIVLTIGSDWTSGTTFGGGTASGGAPAGSPAPVNTQAALSNANAATADDSSHCAEVSHDRTVNLKGVPMTPIQAYAKAPNVPDSAP